MSKSKRKTELPTKARVVSVHLELIEMEYRGKRAPELQRKRPT